MNFDKIVEKTLQWEGGLSDHPLDKGGKTKFGISQRAYPKLNIEKLTLAQAKAIYKRDYFDPLGLEGVSDRIAWKVFDIAVNQGIGTALRYALNADVKNPQISDDVKMFKLVTYQARRYASLVRSNPEYSVFIVGWINRAFDTGEGL